MEKLVIQGGSTLKGNITVSGSKNAALPIMFASILSDTPVTFTNVPRLRDITTTNKLLKTLGCEASFTSETSHEVIVKPGKLSPEAPYELVKTMRASALVLGPLLARLGVAKVALPGGCAIGARPVDQHLKALEEMGAKFELDSGYIMASCKELHGADITFDFPTVGGTENILMAACLAKGVTTLRNAAKEPEVTDLANFLVSCGAKITGIGSDTLIIEGVSSLNASTYSIMPDRVEAGTFMVAAAMVHGDITLINCPIESSGSVVHKLKEMGVIFEETSKGLRVYAPNEIKGTDMVTKPYPGFPTDMQAQLMALMSLAQGSSTITENIFENRFMHVPELIRMGANIMLSGNNATIRGVPSLTAAPVMASDLRASASLVLAGLAAQGTTEVHRIYHLDRGYESIEDKLNAVGASIIRAKSDI